MIERCRNYIQGFLLYSYIDHMFSSFLSIMHNVWNIVCQTNLCDVQYITQT